jgi:hypothetical protein
MVAIQYNSTGFLSQNRCDRSRHVFPARASPSVVFNSRSIRMYFSQLQRVFIVEHYLPSPSYLTCQNEFRDTFIDSTVTNKSTISRLVNRFRDTGSVLDRNRSGRPSVTSDNSLNDIRQTLLRSPRKSLRKLSLQSGLPNEVYVRLQKF